MRALGPIIAAALLAACSSSMAPVNNEPGVSAKLDMSPVSVTNKASTLPADWQKDAVFMQIYVRGYKDSNGDGIGDIKGLTEQLDYLQWLGIKGIWLMPIMESQDHDHGYAVTDYRSIEQSYGTTADFQAFLAEAHKRGIGVIIDYVMNHSAYQNPLFLDSDANRAGKRDWYVWRDDQPFWPNWSSENTWRPGSNGYYYAVFWDQMPDFNLRNQDVLDFHKNNLRYWMNMGVDGFRFDAVGTLVENGRDGMFNQRENGEIMQQVRAVLAEYDNRYLVCEMPDNAEFAGHSSFCGSAFQFPMRAAILGSARFGRVKDNLVSGYNNKQTENMGMFLSNHDGFAGDRVIVQVGGNEQRNRTAAATYLLSTGHPFIYYGEEIGMNHSVGDGVLYKDHALRGPMSWTADPKTAGFTSAKPFRAPANNVADHNVDSEQWQDDSLLLLYRNLIQLRNSEPALRHGSQEALASGSNKIYAFRRTAGNEQIIVAINYGDNTQTLATPALANGHWQALTSSPAAAATITLPPFSYHVWKLE